MSQPLPADPSKGSQLLSSMQPTKQPQGHKGQQIQKGLGCRAGQANGCDAFNANISPGKDIWWAFITYTHTHKPFDTPFWKSEGL